MMMWIILIVVVLAVASAVWLAQRWVSRIEDETSYLPGGGRPVIGNAIWHRIRREVRPALTRTARAGRASRVTQPSGRYRPAVSWPGG